MLAIHEKTVAITALSQCIIEIMREGGYNSTLSIVSDHRSGKLVRTDGLQFVS